MSAKLVQRFTVAALVLAAIGGAIVARVVIANRLHEQRARRFAAVQGQIESTLEKREFYLEDVADMVGVHDDADVREFQRYTHVRSGDAEGDQSVVVSVQWVRRSPTGRLSPAGDLPPHTDLAEPTLIAPLGRANDRLANAQAQPVAAAAIHSAGFEGVAAVSPPVRLAGGESGFYIAVPVEAHRYSGEVSKLESRSAIVGLIDAQHVIGEAFEHNLVAPLRLSDGRVRLAALGGQMEHPITGSLAALNQIWQLTVSGQSLTVLERVLPWLILVCGLALALTVALVLHYSVRRRDEAMRLAQQRTHELEKAHAKAVRRSREDPLTGIFNRRHFSEVLVGELARLRRGGDAPAVLLIDLDHFKSVNDIHGHLAGDAALCASAERIASALRGSDCLARWGGEEFAILAPATDRAGAAALAERARSAFAERPIEANGVPIRLTLSLGVAVGDVGDTPDTLLHRADDALYEAKRAGRDRVRIAEPATSTAVTTSGQSD
jgi:diguanylate cyclase (GGDEF)-like protein